MRALRGLRKDETLQLVEIENFVATGKRLDDLQVTDEWVDESIKFLSTKLRPNLESFAVVADRESAYSLVQIEAKKVCQLWKRGVTGDQMDVALDRLAGYVQKAEQAP